jgi:cytochrome c oxidase subunit 3
MAQGSYYVPEKSSLPIVNALGMFFFGLGSIEVMTSLHTGMILLGIGSLILVVNMVMWFCAIIRENQTGKHDVQMYQTYVWGMFWFLVAQAFFVLLFLGAMFYIRTFTLNWLAGHGPYEYQLTHLLMWPDFHYHWPLLQNPNPTEFIGPRAAAPINVLSIMSLIPMALAAIFVYTAQESVKVTKRARLIWSLAIVNLAGIVFGIIHGYGMYVAIVYYRITLVSGIYGSLFFMVNFVLWLNLLVALIFSIVVMVRAMRGHFNSQNDFSINAAAWLWYFLLGAWLLIFLYVYLF